MKSLPRNLLLFSSVLVGLALILGLLVLTAPVQTMIANSYLADQPGLDSSLGELSAGFNQVTIADLRLRRGGVILNVPSLQADLPVLPALRRRQFAIRHLVAKGWTLDLTNRPLPALPPGAPAAPATLPEGLVVRSVLGAIDALLRRQELPVDLSLAALELEGEVVIPSGPETEPLRFQVKLSGRGPAADRPGVLDLTADTRVDDPRSAVETAAVQGRCNIALETPHALRVSRFELSATADCRNLGRDRRLTARLVAETTAAGTAVAAALDRGARHVAELQLQPQPAANGTAGTWKVALQEADLAPFLPAEQLPEFSVTGDGRIEADAAFTSLRARGTLKAEVGQLARLETLPVRLSHLAAETTFALRRDLQSVRIEQADIALTGANLQVSAHTLQPIAVWSAAAGAALVATDAAGDWLELTAPAFPLARLVNLPPGWTFASGQASGRLLLRATPDGLAFRAPEPLTLRAAALRQNGEAFLPELDATVPLSASLRASGWKLEIPALALAHAGRALGTLALTADSAGPDKPLALRGNWSADLAALVPLLCPQTGAPCRGLTASGEFTSSVGPLTVVDSKATLHGADPVFSVEATAHVESYTAGICSFRVPLQIVTGDDQSNLFVEGTLRRQQSGTPAYYLQLGGTKAQLDHLALLAAPLPLLDEFLRPGRGAALPSDRSRRPVWGDRTGSLRVTFDQLAAHGTLLRNVAGSFTLADDTITLADGQARLPSDRAAKLAGTLRYNPAQPQPYQLEAIATMEAIDAAKLFPAPDRDSSPLIEGRFAFTDTLTSTGATLAELPARLRGQVELTSNAGIVHLLKTRIGDAYAEKPKPVSDALLSGTSAFASIFGVRRNTIGPNTKSVNQATAAVFNFTYALDEIGYQKATVSAVHEPGGPIRITAIALTSPELRLTGSGRIDAAPDRPFDQRPLQIALHLTARGRVAELMSAAGLGDPVTEADGFRRLVPAIEFGGTLADIDPSRWHDVLVAAARLGK